MNKFYYVVQNKKNTEQKEYLIGFCYGWPDISEEDTLNGVKDWCKTKDFRLALLIQIFPVLPIINQLYPFGPTEESSKCMEHVLQAIENNYVQAEDDEEGADRGDGLWTMRQ